MRTAPYKRNSGQSVVELALVLPLVVLLLLGVADLFRIIYAYNTITNMSREGANLTSRLLPAMNAPPLDSQGIMSALGNAAPLDMSRNGMMYITQVQGTGGSPILTTTPWDDHSGPPSTVNQGTLSQQLGDITLRNGDQIYLFEIFYTAEGLFLPFFSKQLHTIVIFKGG
jgi:Flp pilus assembly protein TadG